MDFCSWYKLHGQLDEDKEVWKAGMKAVKRAWWCTFWDWPRGSSIFFWRWPPDYQRVARLGLAPMFDGDPPTSMDYQPPYDDLEVKAKVKAKLQRVLDRGYVEMCDIQLVESLMYMFSVPKGQDDVRMVYDGTRSGLNESLFAPWFIMPNADTMTRWVVAGLWLHNNDYGDFFLNFPLHPDLQKFCGIDLSQLYGDPNEGQFALGRWLRNAMGLKPSPYASIQGGLRAKRIVMGDRKD